MEHLSDERLLDLVDQPGLLEQAPEEQAHLDTCAHCRSQFVLFQTIARDLREPLPISPSSPFTNRVMLAVSGHSAVKAREPRQAAWWILMGLVFGISLMIILLYPGAAGTGANLDPAQPLLAFFQSAAGKVLAYGLLALNAFLFFTVLDAWLRRRFLGKTQA